MHIIIFSFILRKHHNQSKQTDMPIDGDPDVLQAFTNGDPEAISSFAVNINDELSVTTQDRHTGKTKHGFITPLIMKMNQYRDWNHYLVQHMLALGADPKKKVDWFGTPSSAEYIFGSPELSDWILV